MASATARPRPKRILIVEDQAILGMELELLLSHAGHEVVGVAVDSRQALALAEQARPDLALVDIRLKDGATGTTIAERMVAGGITVLFVTAEPELIPSQFAGAFGVLMKPYSAPSVEQAVDYCLALREGEDPGPPPYPLRLAPWLSARLESNGPH